MQSKILLYAFVFALFLAGTAAAAPGTPHQFWGDVKINNAAAPDGTTITCLINGVDVASTTASAGRYGTFPNIFYIEDPDGNREGKTIVFYVNGIESASYVFENGQSTRLNLSITVSTPSPPSDNSPSGGGGGGGGTYCVSEWQCSNWTTCTDGIRTRECTDTKCGREVASNKPEEEQECEIQVVIPTGTCVNGLSVCAGDDLYGCFSNEWEFVETCEYGCEVTDPGKAASCMEAPEGDQTSAEGASLTGWFLQPAGIAAIGAAVAAVLGGTVLFLRTRKS